MDFRLRVPYSPICDRPALKLPGNARLAVWTVIAVEDWDINHPMPRTVLSPPAGQGAVPDIPNWCWHEFGNRVGFWRLKRIFDGYGIKPVLCLNGTVCNSYPQIVIAARKAGWEFMGHGYNQRSMHLVEDEREAIRRSIDALTKATGKPPRGWIGPGLTETFDTVDLLKSEGIEYVGDWVLDEQPCEIATESGPLISIPYTQEINDVAMMLIQHHKASEYRDRAIDQFEQLYADAADSARIMAVSMHPYIMGVAHRARYLAEVYEHMRKREGVLFWTGAQILDWYMSERQRLDSK